MNIFTRLKNKITHDDAAGYAETSEKKTTILGYFFLLVMFVFLVGVGQTVFSDLRTLIPAPERPSFCSSRLVDNPTRPFSCSERTADCGCQFTDIDNEFGIPDLFSSIQSSLQTLDELNDEIRELDSALAANQRERAAAERQYELSLQERVAGADSIIVSGQEQQILQLRAEAQVLTANRAELLNQQSTLQAEITPQLPAIETAYDGALEAYQQKVAVYKILVFLLSLVFIAPIFWYATRRYLKAKRADSPYTIIFTAFMAAAGILLLQVLLVFLYDVLPLHWLVDIFALLANIPFFRFIVYYGVVGLVVAIFGGIVFLIQRRIFNEKRVALRRLRKNECPRCTFIIRSDDQYCPGCGETLKKTCGSCGKHRSVHTRYCNHCGAMEAE